eukprot:1158604-Pelagomonas_calceolata.AAC.3
MCTVTCNSNGPPGIQHIGQASALGVLTCFSLFWVCMPPLSLLALPDCCRPVRGVQQVCNAGNCQTAQYRQHSSRSEPRTLTKWSANTPPASPEAGDHPIERRAWIVPGHVQAAPSGQAL